MIVSDGSCVEKGPVMKVDITWKDSYPLPRIDEALDYVGGLRWYSSLYLQNGYWQVEHAVWAV